MINFEQIKSDYIVIFESCKIVNGYTNSLIIDIQRDKYFQIDNNTAKVLNLINRKKIETILKLDFYTTKEIKKLIIKLFKEEIIFTIKDKKNFPAMENVFKNTSTITNSIFTVSNTTFPLFNNFLDQLNTLGTYFIEARILLKGYGQLKEILNVINKSNLNSVELVLNFNKKIFEFISNPDNFVLIQKIYCIKLFNAPAELLMENFPKTIFLENISKNKFENNFCGMISREAFNTNTFFYTESLHHNSCLNRKISIDAEGNIKNCPSMKESYGNIKDTTLAEAIEKPGFKKYWNINKDKIAVCRDCEFRYICTDCRAYVEEPEDASGPDGTNLSKPLKCGYNPYTGEWAEWSTNPLKQKGIDFYGMRKMVNEKVGES